MQKDTTTRDAAIAYAKRGWAVFPCKPKAKTPATANGFKDASADPATVERMFSGRNDYNLGVATGSGSGFWALDLDPGYDDNTVFIELVRGNGGLPATFRQKTPRGGEHYLFQFNGKEIKSRAKIGGEPIDTRGVGGYIVLDPSKTEDGDYLIVDENAPVLDAPEWLVEFVTSKDSADSALTQGKLQFTIDDHDLATAPGAAKGKRHDQALRLIGSAFGRGLDLVTVGQQAIAWAGRCSPPMDGEEALRLVRDLGKKEGVKIDAIEDEPLPAPPAWPELGDHAYHGLAGEIVKAIEPQTEADPAAVLVQLLCSFGNLVGRTAHYIVEGTSHHANLFVVLVGATARGRKGTSEGRVRMLLRSADEDWSTHRIASGLVSGEGIVWAVRDPIIESKPIKDKKKIVGYEEIIADPGVDDKRLLVIESEFASVLRAGRRETSTLSPTLRSAWDSGDLRTLAKNSPARSTGAHISLVGHVTSEELRRTMPEVEGFSGFANRFLWIAVRRSKLLPDGGDDLDLTAFADRLRTAAEHAKLVDRMHRDKAATRLWRTIYADLAGSSGGGMFGAVTSRAEAQALRLSMIYALLDRSTIITAEHLTAAISVWKYAEDSARMIFNNSTGDNLADKLLAFIKAEPGIKRRDLRRKFSSSQSNDSILAALGRLRDFGLAHPVIEKKTKPSEAWYPGCANDKSANSPQSFGNASCANDKSANSPGSGGSEKRIGRFGIDPERMTKPETPPEWEEFTL